MPDTTNENTRLGDVAGRIMMPAVLIGAFLLIGSVIIGAMTGWERFLRSYLVAFMFITTLSLGALFFTFIQHLTRAGWSASVRRVAELLASNLQWIGILFIPVLIGMWTSESTHLYSWATEAAHHDEVLQHKAGYLNPWFWTVRAIAFLGIWALFSRFFFRNSLAQDASGDPELTSRMQSVAAPFTILFALTVTFAAVDWMMSLEAHWFSTMFGVYTFAACCASGFSAMILVIYLLQRAGRCTESITLEHYQDMGKILFGFGVVFWAYIGYSQYMLIWYGNIPEETTWFMARQLGGWAPVSMFLLIGHFFVPFLAIMSRHVKRARGVLAIAAVWMLLMNFIDMYWLIMPHVPSAIHDATSYREFAAAVNANMALPVADRDPAYSTAYGWHFLDLTCVAGMIALYVAVTVRRMRDIPLVPQRDPRLHEALAFENM